MRNVAGPAALADRLGQIIFRLETNLSFIGRGPMDAPVRVDAVRPRKVEGRAASAN